MNTSGTTYWCHNCDRFITLHTHHFAICPLCSSSFLPDHHINHLSPISPPPPPPFSASYNPVIALPTSPTHTHRLFFDDGSGSGLQPIPEPVSHFLMSSGFHRVLSHLSISSAVPAAKSAVETIPTVKVSDGDSHCAVCKDVFEVDTEVKELPCKHIYHPGCILPWLSLRNSCPVCRFKLPGEDESVGLRIWRLPSGGFAVGRFMGGDREFPVVYTEMDGGFEGHSGGVNVRRVSWPVSGRSGGEGGQGLGRVFRGLASLFRRNRNSGSGQRSRNEGSFGV